MRQLEAFNALSQKEKLKIQTKGEGIKPIATSTFEIENQTEQFVKASPKLEIIEGNSPIEFLQQKDIELPAVPENPIRRVFIGNQLNGTPFKANPKAVTASVFKSLPGAANSLKHKLNGTTNNVQHLTTEKAIETPLLTPKVSPFMKIAAIDARDSLGKFNSINFEPSLLPRQTVVTASLFQPRRALKEIGSSNTLCVDKIESRAADIMNKSFCTANDNLCRTTCEYKFDVYTGQMKMI